jgi:hypothetical protein
MDAVMSNESGEVGIRSMWVSWNVFYLEYDEYYNKKMRKFRKAQQEQYT